MTVFRFFADDVREMLSQIETSRSYVVTCRDLFSGHTLDTWPDVRRINTCLIQPQFILTVGATVFMQTNAVIRHPTEHLITFAHGYNPVTDEIKESSKRPLNIVVSKDKIEKLLSPFSSVLKLTINDSGRLQICS